MTETPLKILVVDDEPFMIRLIEIVLERDGHRTLRAANGTEAVEVARRERPSVIIMDGMMPQMDGLTALRLLKEDRETQAIPVILLTANPNKFSREDAVSSGATVFLTKPFSPTHLLAEIRRIQARGAAPSGGEGVRY
jgi:two-component system, OmpR family, alkaline phosphatase synthesis response regulator PhoP